MSLELILQGPPVGIGRSSHPGIRHHRVIDTRIADRVRRRPVGNAGDAGIDRRRSRLEAEIASGRIGEFRIRLKCVNVLPARGAVSRNGGVGDAHVLHHGTVRRVPEEVVVGHEAIGGALIDPEIETVGRQSVVDSHAIIELRSRGAAVDRESVIEVVPSDIADMRDAGGKEVVEAVIRIVPRDVLDRKVVVRPVLHVQPFVGIVVQSVSLNQVAAGAVEIDARPSVEDVGDRVPGALVVLHRAAGRAGRERDPLIVVVRNDIAFDQRARAREGLYAGAKGEVDSVSADDTAIRAVRQVDPSVLGPGEMKALDRDERLPIQPKPERPPADSRVVIARIVPLEVDIETLSRDPGEAVGRNGRGQGPGRVP